MAGGVCINVVLIPAPLYQLWFLVIHFYRFMVYRFDCHQNNVSPPPEHDFFTLLVHGKSHERSYWRIREFDTAVANNSKCPDFLNRNCPYFLTLRTLLCPSGICVTCWKKRERISDIPINIFGRFTFSVRCNCIRCQKKWIDR